MPPAWRRLAPGQVARVCTFDVVTGERRVVHETSEAVVEAPNWSPDGRHLYVNREGLIYRLAAEASGDGAGEVVATGHVREANNDHVLSPDGRYIYLSNGDGHLYEVPLGGGEPRRVSNNHPEPFRYFLHGISPDGRQLAYTGARQRGDDPFALLEIFTLAVAGGPDVQLTSSGRPSDGPEYSPDGEWIYFNSEMGSERAGHAQLYRVRTDGTGLQQLSSDERVNWFPHLSPDGSRMVYLSYPPGTTGHPADKTVLLRSMPPEGGPYRDLVELQGGQGTFNVNSWAPDNQRFAYVEYPLPG